MKKEELYLKTAFCCMACDGDIATEEVALLKQMAEKEQIFGNLDVQYLLNQYIQEINAKGVLFLDKYIESIKDSSLSKEDELELIRIAIGTIEADEQIEYSEIRFFKRIRKNLVISDEEILEVMPDKEDYLLPDIEVSTDFDWNFCFDAMNLLEVKLPEPKEIKK